MKLSIQLHLSGLSLSNTVRVLEILVSNALDQPFTTGFSRPIYSPGKNPDHVAVDETVIQLNDEQYWLYATVDAATKELLHTTLEPIRNRCERRRFSLRSASNTTFLKQCFSLMARSRCKLRVVGWATISDTKNMEMRTLSNVSLEK